MKLTKKILLWIFLSLVSLMVVFSLLLILFTQVSPFRGWLADTVISYVNDELNAKISVSDLYLNPFSGVEVWDAAMTVDGDTLAYVEKITIDADFFDLLSGKITVSRLELDNPRILLQKKYGADKWNFELIARPTPEEPPSPLPELIFDIKNLSINNGHFKVRNFNDTVSVSEHINFVNLDISGFNLLLNAFADLKELSFSSEINKIAFLEKNSGFKMKDFDLNLKADKKGIELGKLAITTDSSDIGMSAYAKNINIFDSFSVLSFIPGQYNLKLDFEKISPYDIKHFTDYFPKLESDIALSLSLSGSVGEMILDKFNLIFGSTNISFIATGTNLAIEKFRTLNVTFNQSNIEFKDIEPLLPAYIFEYIPKLEFASIESLIVSFKNNIINSDMDIRTADGTVKGNAELNIEEEIYNGKLSTTNLNLVNITGSDALYSSINADVRFSGSSFDFDKMESKVDIQAEASKFIDYGFNGLKFTGRVSKSAVYADTLILAFGNKPSGEDNLNNNQSETLNFRGQIDFKNTDIPKYNGTLTLNNINLKQILNSPDAPKNISGELSIDGSGFDPDDMNGKMEADITYLEYLDKAFMPFSVKTSFESLGSKRKLDIESSFMDLSVEGNYSYDNLIALIQTQGNYLAGYINKKIYDVDFGRKTDALLPESVIKSKGFKPFELKIKGNINDLSPLSAFLDSTKLFLKAKLDISIAVTEKTSSIKIDSLNIYSFFFEMPGINLAVRPTQISSDLSMDIRDSALHLSNMGLKVSSNFPTVFNEMEFLRPNIDINIVDDILRFNISGGFGNDITAAVSGSVLLKNKKIDIDLEKLMASYKNSLNFHNTKNILVDITSTGLNIRQFELMRDSSETINISGKFNDFIANEFKINISNLPLDGYNSLLPESVSKIMKMIKGKIESLDIVINDSLKNPDIKFQLQANNLTMENLPLGSLQAFLHHSNGVVKGSLGLVRRYGTELQKLLSVDVNSLPINLALKNIDNRIHENAPLNVSAYTDKLPIYLFSPFLVGIADNLKGHLDFEIDLFGSLNKTINYSGKVQMKNAFFHLVPNNMSYYTDIDLEIKYDTVKVKNIEIRNNPVDWAKGKMNLNGEISLKEFTPQTINMYLRSRGIKVLSQASAASLPTLFGDVVVSTGPRDIYFLSDLKYSNLIGSVIIDNARLYMPNKRTTQSTISKIKYEVIGSKVNISLEDSLKAYKDKSDSLIAYNTEKNSTNSSDGSFYNGMSIDLDIRINKPIYLDMDLFSLFFTQKLTAEIGVLDQSNGLKLFKERNSEDAKLYGELELKKGSKLSFIKVFNTDGTISFPTGNMGDPYLNLTAEYNGITDINNTQRNFKVILHITGSKDMPKIDFSYSIDNEIASGDSTKIREDAMFLLIAGRTKAELFSSGGAQANIVSELSNTGLSAAMSTALNQILAGTIIRSADIELSESWEETKLKLTGQLIGYVGWKFGGNVADLMGNNEITIELPLDFILSNALIQFTWTTNTETIISKDQKKGEIKFQIRGSF